MIGEIYVAFALAIFLAVFGWSERIFGLSSKHLQSILAFCEKSKLTYKKYLELMDLISKDKTTHPGIFQKKLISILKDSAIKKGDKKVMKKLKENSHYLKSLETQNNHKKIYFVILFLFLFIGGSVLFYLDNVQLYYFESMITAQIILLIIIGIGTWIYNKITYIESKIQNNLLLITTEIEDTKDGR